MKTGYLPPYDMIEAGLEISPDGSKITMSRELFHQFVAMAALGATFDDVWYRTEYTDVAEAVEAGVIADELEHFSHSGYAEGRRLAYFEVDEEWYLRTYPDVARAIAAGEVLDAESHYNDTGYAEGRASDEATEAMIWRWRHAVHESAERLNGGPVDQPEPAADGGGDRDDGGDRDAAATA